MDGFRWGDLFLQMSKYLLDHRRVLDAGNDPGGPAAGAARLDVEIENPLEATVATLRAAHGLCAAVQRNADDLVDALPHLATG